MLISLDMAPWHWAPSGALLGVITLILLFVGNKALGISTGFESFCALVSKRPYFRRAEVSSGGRWRLVFVAGLVLGGGLSVLLAGDWHPTWELGRLDAALGLAPAGKLVWMFAGGLAIGVGTRLAGGCTSGHGIFGLSSFEVGSLVSTLGFMAAGVVTSNVVYHLVLS